MAEGSWCGGVPFQTPAPRRIQVRGNDQPLIACCNVIMLCGFGIPGTERRPVSLPLYRQTRIGVRYRAVPYRAPVPFSSLLSIWGIPKTIPHFPSPKFKNWRNKRERIKGGRDRTEGRGAGAATSSDPISLFIFVYHRLVSDESTFTPYETNISHNRNNTMPSHRLHVGEKGLPAMDYWQPSSDIALGDPSIGGPLLRPMIVEREGGADEKTRETTSAEERYLERERRTKIIPRGGKNSTSRLTRLHQWTNPELSYICFEDDYRIL
ncbi:hypothetical protein B0H63DRAFT_204365 [Podospora didyma]|uniref:Uncharacterized protein n=1 Tax=Podospora didyma TaxID=330526 RepID=A0AAE0NH81_9PEZI|nr:hypothetical protein B0H63DRAFT_204365 [Podospora didyma]